MHADARAAPSTTRAAAATHPTRAPQASAVSTYSSAAARPVHGIVDAMHPVRPAKEQGTNAQLIAQLPTSCRRSGREGVEGRRPALAQLPHSTPAPDPALPITPHEPTCGNRRRPAPLTGESTQSGPLGCHRCLLMSPNAAEVLAGVPSEGRGGGGPFHCAGNASPTQRLKLMHSRR